MEVVNQESMEGLEEENDSTGEESIEETEENNLETSFTAADSITTRYLEINLTGPITKGLDLYSVQAFKPPKQFLVNKCF